jgi:hypothetical protein
VHPCVCVCVHVCVCACVCGGMCPAWQRARSGKRGSRRTRECTHACVRMQAQHSASPPLPSSQWPLFFPLSTLLPPDSQPPANITTDSQLTRN